MYIEINIEYYFCKSINLNWKHKPIVEKIFY